MTGYSNNIQAYKNAFGNIDKVNQVIMLYDTAIASLQQARQAIVDKNIEERFNKISKAFAIITGLRDSLDHANGGEVAAVLSEWYSGTGLRILSINRTQDVDMCDMCIEHIKQMRTAWSEIETQVKEGGGKAPSEEKATSALGDSSSGTGGIEAAPSQKESDDYFTAASKIAASGHMNISV